MVTSLSLPASAPFCQVQEAPLCAGHLARPGAAEEKEPDGRLDLTERMGRWRLDWGRPGTRRPGAGPGSAVLLEEVPFVSEAGGTPFSVGCGRELE